jgi:cardiolipin synthase
VGYDFLSVLERKATEGVRIIIILDAFGSFAMESASIDRLRIAGVEVLFFSYWFRRTHRKILIVDERVAFVGGVNIGQGFARWRDLQMRISGKIVRHILRSFARVYHECGGKNVALEGITPAPLLRKTRLWFIEHGVGKKRHELRLHYEKHIDGAHRTVVLVTPHLIPPRWLITCLHRAIARKVNVAIIVPKQSIPQVINRINYYYVSLFAKLGATCFLSDEMNHAKVMLIDDRLGTVGSQNLDTLSFEWNAEAGVFFDNARMIRDLRGIIQKWMEDAKPFAVATSPSHWYDVVLALCLRLFQATP